MNYSLLQRCQLFIFPILILVKSQECVRKENVVSHELATFTLKLVYQDPKNGFEEDQPLDKDSIEKLTKLCVDKILEDHGPLMETVRMQVSQNLGMRFKGYTI